MTHTCLKQLVSKNIFLEPFFELQQEILFWTLCCLFMPIKVEQCCVNRKSGLSIINETFKTTVLPLKSQLSSPSFPLNQIIHAPLYCTVIMVQGVGLQHSKLLSTDYHWPNGEFQLYTVVTQSKPIQVHQLLLLDQSKPPAIITHIHTHTCHFIPEAVLVGKKYQTCRLCDCFSLRCHCVCRQLREQTCSRYKLKAQFLFSAVYILDFVCVCTCLNKSVYFQIISS